jgi:hypothetical protein
VPAAGADTLRQSSSCAQHKDLYATGEAVDPHPNSNANAVFDLITIGYRQHVLCPIIILLAQV